MAKEEIVEGLRQAVSKGESLEKAMMSFYNSGYLKEDIEEAARAMSLVQRQPQSQSKPTIGNQEQSNAKPLKQATVPPQQKVSNYGGKPHHYNNFVIFLLVFLLLGLIGLLAGLVFFKDEIASLFGLSFGLL